MALLVGLIASLGIAVALATSRQPPGERLEGARSVAATTRYVCLTIRSASARRWRR
jgi:hypothetical protein